ANPTAIDAFLEKHDFPLVEGRSVTFVFRGQADAVLLRHWIYGLPSSREFERLPGSDLWFLIHELPARSRVEYKLELHQGKNKHLVRDPLNPHEARDPYGANSVVHGEGYQLPEWTAHDANARPGEIIKRQLNSSTFGDVRPLSIYKPARFRETRRYPLLVVHDGLDYLRFASLQTVLDNLIHRLEIPPIIVALTQSPNRLHEYADDPRHADFIVDELLPLITNEFPLVDDPAARSLVGASFGAVAALSTAVRKPGVFGNLLLQSGSFAFTDIGDHDRGPVFDPVVKFVNDFREQPTKPAARIFLTCGTYESLIYYSRSLLPLLQSTGAEVRYEESRDGHNWENWRDRLRDGLTWLAPGPLWMVYE
ncbi:MAG: alpha/beta hydrolase-fold protein, partial [Planctomycetota bacterium]|nr:alpha/beta hydrolase-fold protein [Planctomycetota bacterium]